MSDMLVPALSGQTPPVRSPGGKPIYTTTTFATPMAEPDRSEFQRKATFVFFLIILAAGILLYWGWGVLYDTWNPFTRGNIGIYAIYMPMILFGIIGVLLYRKKK